MTYERAVSMMSYVGPYYRRSRIYQAQNEAKAAEFNLLRSMIDEVADQFFVETSTWGIARWEQYCGLRINDADSIEIRRQRIISWLQILSPITPKAMQRLCEGAVHTPVDIVENVAPYTFGVYFDFFSSLKMSIPDLLNVIEEAKPAHLAFFLHASLYVSAGEIGYGGAISAVHSFLVEPLRFEKMELQNEWQFGGFLSGISDVIIEPLHFSCIEITGDLAHASTLSMIHKISISEKEVFQNA